MLFTAACLNTRGGFCCNGVVSDKKWNHYASLLEQCDVLILLDTHSTEWKTPDVLERCHKLNVRPMQVHETSSKGGGLCLSEIQIV